MVEHFSLGVTAKALYTTEYRLQIGFIARTGSVWPKIAGTRDRPHQPFFLRKTRMIDISYGIKLSAEVSFVLSTRLTDRRTDISAMANTALHSMQRGKKDMSQT